MAQSQLEALEQQMLQITFSGADTASIRAAEIGVRAFMRQPQSVPCFVELLRRSQHVGVRQLSAICVRRRVVAHWPRLDAVTRNGVKAGLLDALHKEPQRVVQRCTAAVVAVLSKLLVPANQWNEVVQFALDAANADGTSWPCCCTR